jgi:hypothetical protein
MEFPSAVEEIGYGGDSTNSKTCPTVNTLCARLSGNNKVGLLNSLIRKLVC